MKKLEFIESLGIETFTYLAYDINGYLGCMGANKEELKRWIEIVNDREVNYTLADFLNANRIFNQAIYILSNPKVLANFRIEIEGKEERYKNLRYPIYPSTLIEILDLEFPVMNKVNKNFKEVIEYETPERYEVYEKAKKILEKRQKNKPKVKKNIKKHRGVVYLLKIKDKKQYKIGVSTKFKSRYDKLSTLMPFELITINKIKSNDIYALEEKLHKKFSDKRINGEWFELEKKDVKYIKSIEDDIDE